MSKWIMTAAMTLFASVSLAKEPLPFDAKAFEAAQKEGKTIVLSFRADWCPACRKQEPNLKTVLDEKKFANVVAFKVEFDDAPNERKRFRVFKTSTLVVFKGHEEVTRRMGLVRAEQIREHLDKGI